MIARGEIWWYEPATAKPRPVLVLTRNEALEHLQQILGVPATTTIRGIPTEVALDQSDGLSIQCVLTLDNVQPVRRALLTERITMLGADRMREVCEALRHAVAC